MPQNKNFAVWMWLDEDDVPAYVGWGRYNHNHPAKAMWAARNSYDSELNLWLRTLKREPKRCDKMVSQPLFKVDCRAVAVQARERAARKGLILLESRPDGTRAGGGAPRLVLDPQFKVHLSVRKAAEAYGVNPSSVTRWCQDPDVDWDFFD